MNPISPFVQQSRRAAEKLGFNEISGGAEEYLAKATDIARSMTMRFGIGETIGPVALKEKRLHWLPTTETGPRDFSEETARELNLDVRAVITHAFACACARTGKRSFRPIERHLSSV